MIPPRGGLPREVTISTFADASPTGLVPLFPLPEVTLLPGEMFPLYVFEPRYRQLLEDAQDGERLIALPRFQPGWREAYHANPLVHPCLGVGRIAAARPRPDGTSDVVLHGVARVRLLEVVREMPYRLARVDDLDEAVSDPARLAEIVAEIDERLREDAAGPIAPGSALEALGGRLAEIPGRLAATCRFSSDEKQRMLEADDLVERLELVRRHLARRKGRERVSRLLAGHGSAGGSAN
ncbi:MAG: LON peptidase substrate-binding domain-containing protein [Planctomycetota bacterium JB042]